MVQIYIYMQKLETMTTSIVHWPWQQLMDI